MDKKDMKDFIFKKVQDFLKPCPVIIWGSGATIPFGMPSMEELKKELKIQPEGNLEDILSKENGGSDRLKQYQKKIYTILNKKDKELQRLLKKFDDSKIKFGDSKIKFDSYRQFINYFYSTHPQCVNFITTNYDCVLEHILSYYGYSFSDGYSGREFSKFDESFFHDKEHINLFKAHGSLRWCGSNSRYSYNNNSMHAIFPTKHKYETSVNQPFRKLIARSDNVIENSKSFLSVGFGFNDKHLTPTLETAIKDQSKIVILAKKATKSVEKIITEAKQFVLIEEAEAGKTQFRFRKDNSSSEISTEILEGTFWDIPGLTKILI